MKTLIPLFFTLLIFSCQQKQEALLIAQNGHTEAEATCTGSASCKACKNCKYCKHCSKSGNSCGVCK